MHRRSVALSAIALAFASMPSTGLSSVRPDRPHRLDGRVGRLAGGEMGLAAAGSGYMSPQQLVARSTHLARRRQTRGRRAA